MANLCSPERVVGRAVRSGYGLPVAQEVFERRTDILDDLPQDHGRHVSAGMVRNGGAASIGVPILHVRATLPGQDKTQGTEDAAHLTGLEDGRPWHRLRGNGDALRADELRVQIRLPILQQHLDDLAEVTLEFVQRLALRMGARKTGNVTDVEPGIRTTFNDGGECSHGLNVLRSILGVKEREYAQRTQAQRRG